MKKPTAREEACNRLIRILEQIRDNDPNGPQGLAGMYFEETQSGAVDGQAFALTSETARIDTKICTSAVCHGIDRLFSGEAPSGQTSHDNAGHPSN